jgi:predicted ArsR family transcriptional regulator
VSAVADDLVDPVDVDEDDLAPEDRLPESEGGGVDQTRGRPNAILASMRSLGPATAKEIAERIGRETGNVSTRLRQMEQEGRVRRTGRAVSDGQGSPSIEWEIMPANGKPTEPGVTQNPPAPIEFERERVRALSHRVEDLAKQLEARQDERDRARQDVREVRDELRARGARVSELEREVEQLQAAARRPAEIPAEIPAENPSRLDMRERYFALLLEMAGREGAEEHVFDRLERLVDGPSEYSSAE